MTFSLKQMQAEHAAWSQFNFGKHPAWHPLLGMVEEIGELEEAIVLKNETEIKDSIADILIFMSDFCTYMNFDLEEISMQKVHSYRFRTRSSIIGRISHSYLKMDQGIRGTPEQHRNDISKGLSELYENLALYCMYHDENLFEILEDTWNKVKQRNWKNNPTTGE